VMAAVSVTLDVSASVGNDKAVVLASYADD